MTGLPVDVGICTVTGTLKSGEQIEGSDPAPDLAGLSGYVKFTPSTTRTVHYGSEYIIHLKPITADLDENGYFETQLIATDDTDLAPYGWTYTVSFHLIGARMPTFAIEAPQGTTVDLSSVVPVAVANGTTIVQGGPPGPDGDSAYDIAVAAGFVGDEAAWLASLVGDPGPAGPVPEAPVDGTPYSRQDAGWVAAAGGVPEAPVDGTPYVREDAGWIALPAPDLSGYYTAAQVDTALSDKVSSDGSITDIVTMTQAAYDALGTYDPTTMYVIVG